jgi:hypothetical protein
VKVRIALKVKDPRIVPDMGVKVSFLDTAPTAAASPKSEGVRVPVAAIAQRDGKPVVFVLGANGKVAQRTVKVGRDMDEDRQVLDGLSAGETVVLQPPPALADGMKVRVASDAGDGAK